MKQKFVFILIIVVLVTLACQSSTSTAVFTQKSIIRITTPEVTAEFPVQLAKAPTDTPGPTDTPAPTRTPRPTSTKKPTLTATPVPQPIELTGTGDRIVDLERETWPGIAHITHSGNGNFAVINYDAQGEYLGLLVNTIGNYEGKRLIDIKNNEYTSRFEVKADGNWTITIYPLLPEYVTYMDVPGTYSGTGDDVIALHGSPDIATFNYLGDGNFAVIGYSSEDWDLLVNEIGPYNGQAIVPNGTVLLEVTADDPWTMEITSR